MYICSYGLPVHIALGGERLAVVALGRQVRVRASQLRQCLIVVGCVEPCQSKVCHLFIIIVAKKSITKIAINQVNIL